MHSVFDSAQLPQNRPSAARRLAEIYWPSSERRDYTVEPTPHGLFAFEHLHGTEYQFKLVNLS